MVANRQVDTRPELKNHSLDLDGLTVRPDIVFSGARVAVFVDGCFWHRCPLHATDPKTNSDYWEPKLRGNVERDKRVERALSAYGWTVVRVWEHENPNDAADRVSAVLKRRV
jgi:DNA mismatch endonuclease (patch repair protein)